MIYFTIVFLCMAGLFLCLLEDRFRLWITVGGAAGTYLLALAAGWLLRRGTEDPLLARQLPCIAGAALFFLSSLILYRNNFLQKLFLALLSLCNFAFLDFFLPLLLGALPFKVSGAFGGVVSVLGTLLFNLLLGLCLYHPLRHFRDRGPSGFLAGICLLLVGLYILCLGRLDFLFRTNIFAARLLLAVLLYLALIFAFRSLYQAGRFRERAARRADREQLLRQELSGAEELLAAVREVRSAEKAGEYALDTISVMMADGLEDKIPEYIQMAKRNMTRSPILETYHADPALNAVIAAKAAFAKQRQIAFECNAVTDGGPLETGELCVVAGELLSRACRDAAAYDGPRKIRFTVFPTQEALRFETVYTGTLPGRERTGPGGGSFSERAARLFEEAPQTESDLSGLETTRELIGKYSGLLSVSSGGQDEIILQASFRK